MEVEWKLWYDGNRILTYNCLFNFIVGNRGCGKSFWAKRWGINGFLKNKKQWVYLRRYETEFDEIDTYFDDIKEFYPDVEFKVEGGNFFINNEKCGIYTPLSKASILKSNPYPEVNKIIFDEFIIEKGVHRYLPYECRKFLDFYETINRTRDGSDATIVFFLSNAITMTNPYFLYFNLKLPFNNNITHKNDLLLQLVADEEFIEMKKNTRFGKITQGTDYAAYSIDNKFLLDNNTFIDRKTGSAKYYFTMKYNGTTFGIWIDRSVSKMFVSYDVEPTCRIIYSITLDDHSPNTMLLKSISKAVLFKTFIDNYNMGNVYFENINIKNIVYDIIRKVMAYS